MLTLTVSWVFSLAALTSHAGAVESVPPTNPAVEKCASKANAHWIRSFLMTTKLVGDLEGEPSPRVDEDTL